MSEYITPAEATKIRVHHEGGGAWAIDAADDAGRYTESNWDRDGSHDNRMTRERAIELVPEFVAHLGLPAGLPIEVHECDPPRVVEVIRRNPPIDPCHVPIHRGVEHWNTLALESQIHVLDQLIAADMAAGCEHSGWHVSDREDHPLEAILDYLRETLEKCGGAR
jgi:hypothetical protein